MKTIFKLKKIIFTSLVLILITNFYKVNAQQNTRTFSCIYQDATDANYAKSVSSTNVRVLDVSTDFNSWPEIISYALSDNSLDDYTKCIANSPVNEHVSFDQGTCSLTEEEIQFHCGGFGLANGEVHNTNPSSTVTSNRDIFSSIPRSVGLS